MKWLAERSIYRDSVDLLLVDEHGDKLAVAMPAQLILVDQDRHMAINEPTLRLDDGQGQSLMQALWDAGLRPNDGAGSGAEVQALKKHIAFAERIADGLLARVPGESGAEPNG